MIDININPVAFLGVRWYGIMVALAVGTLVFWAIRQSKRGANYTYDNALTAAMVGIPSGIIFSKVLHIIDYIVIAKLHPELVASGAVTDYTKNIGQMFSGAGLTIEGAVLGAAFGIWVYTRVSKSFRYGHFVDAIAPGIILAQAIGRVGCLFNGCCYGIETNAPWGIFYTHPEAYAPLGISFHPTQFYEIIYNLLVFGILVMLSGRLKPPGSLFLVYLTFYAVWRLSIDFIRDGNPFLFGLHQAQVVSIIILLITVPLLILRTRWIKDKKEITLTV